MDLLSAHDLIRLADERGGTRVSLFLPTHRGGPRTDRNRIRLKNLLATARRALLAERGRAGEVDAVLDPAQQFLDEMRSWEQPRDGLALFLGPSGLRRFRIPVRLPELVTVGDRFVVRPLLPLLTAGGRFYVMALSQDEIRLFEGTRFSLDELALDGAAVGDVADDAAAAPAGARLPRRPRRNGRPHGVPRQRRRQAQDAGTAAFPAGRPGSA